MAMPERNGSPQLYRYSLNGQEREHEITGTPSHSSTEYWMYDSRIGRRWEMDPVLKTSESLYATFSNNPITNNDRNGLTATKYQDKDGKLIKDVNDGSDKTVTVDRKQFRKALKIARNKGLDIDNNKQDAAKFDETYQKLNNSNSDIVYDVTGSFDEFVFVGIKDAVKGSSKINTSSLDVVGSIIATVNQLKKTVKMFQWRNELLSKNTFLMNDKIYSLKSKANTNPIVTAKKQEFVQAAKTAEFKANGISKISSSLTLLGYATPIYQLFYDDAYGQGFGSRNNEFAADFVSNTVAWRGGYAGIFIAYMYQFRIKPMLKANTVEEKRAVASSPRALPDGYSEHSHSKNPNVGGYGDSYGRSDSTLKCNIQLIDREFLKKLLLIKVYRYNWKDTTDMNFSIDEFGVLAQEMKQIFPNLVKEVDGKFFVSYFQLIPLLLEGFKEQEQMIIELYNRITVLEKKIKEEYNIEK